MKKDLTNLTKRYKTKGTILFCLLCHHIYSQETNKDPQQYIPQPFIDKIELVIGPSVTFPDGKDRFAGNNPNIRTAYFAKAGYSAGIGLIHSIRKFELKARLLWDQKAYVFKTWADDPSGLFQSTNDYKLNYLTLSIMSGIYLDKASKLQLNLGLSSSRFQNLIALDSTYKNGMLQYASRFTSDSGVANYSFDALVGVSYVLYKMKKVELSAMLQADYGLKDIINENGTIIKLNKISIMFSIKFINNRKIFYKQLKANNV